MSVEIRPIAESELQQYVSAVNRGFGADMIDGEPERVSEVIGLDRVHAAFDGERIVGTIAAYAFEMAVPGSVDVETSGLTRVTVAASHRRQGVLSEMMATHLDHAVANGEALSILWASEVAIYGRFGYGPATEFLNVSFDSRFAHISRPETLDTLDQITDDEAAKILPDLRERIRIGRPGKYARTQTFWTHRHFMDPEAWRDGASAMRRVVATRNGEPVGYASYRHKKHWDEVDLPDGQIIVDESGGIDLQAQHTIWWYLANIDLFPKVSIWSQPTDTVLPWLAGNSRAISRQLSDGIHLRMLDVQTALTARRYAYPGDLVFHVTDDRRPDVAGTYRLSAAEDGTGVCERSDAEPEISLTAYALGSLYLGSIRPEPLAASGHITGPGSGGLAGQPIDGPDPLRRVRELFSWPVAAWCDEGF